MYTKITKMKQLIRNRRNYNNKNIVKYYKIKQRMNNNYIMSAKTSAETVYCTQWGKITRPLAPNGKTLLLCYFGIKIPKTKHEIMLHAMSLNLPTLLTAFTA